MKQGRKSRCAWALLSALFALSAAAPAASAAPAAVEEYDLALPDPNGPSDPNAPAAEEAPAPVAPGPVAPAPTEAVAPTETAPMETAATTPSGEPTPEPEKLDQAAIRRDVLFERPEKISTPLPKAPYERTRDSASAPTALLGFVAIGAVCIAASLWRMRRFARDAAAHGAPAGVSDPQASS